MLYPVLRFVSGIALRWYYREVTIVGAERIPREAPVLLTVNHPNALVDALVVGWLVPRRITITAKAVLFDNPVLGAFLRAIGVVPLRRASDERARGRTADAQGNARGNVQMGAPMKDPGNAPVDAARNAAAFDAILDALDARRAVLIFPEGKSHDNPGLEPLKTGPARIALAARDAGRARGLAIVPVGLVFEDKAAVRSRVVAVVGDPLDVHDWEVPPAGARTETLTREIDARLRRTILSATSAESLTALHTLATHVAEVLAPVAPAVGSPRSLGEEYAIAARIAAGLDAIPILPAGLQARAQATRARMDAFIAALRAAGIAPSDASISLRKRHGARFALRELALLALAGPVALWGRANHWVPFRLARHVALRNVTARDQPAMRTIVAGLGFVLGAYALQAALAWWLFGGWVAGAYLLTLPVAADVDLRYSGRLRVATRRMRAYLMLRRDPARAMALQHERAALAEEIAMLDAAITAEAPAGGGPAGGDASAAGRPPAS